MLELSMIYLFAVLLPLEIYKPLFVNLWQQDTQRTGNTTTQKEQLETKQKENTQCYVQGSPTNVHMSGTQAQHYHW